MVVSDGENTVAVECDGVEDENESNVRPSHKQELLERCGFKVIRITYRSWYYSKNACLNNIKKELVSSKLPE